MVHKKAKNTSTTKPVAGTCFCCMADMVLSVSKNKRFALGICEVLYDKKHSKVQK